MCQVRTRGRCQHRSMPAGPLAERLIGNLPLFRHVAREHVAFLAKHATVHQLKRGDIVCRRGEPLECFFGVAYGQMKLVLRAGNGEERVLRIVGAGDTFGEALVHRPRANALDAIALSDALVIALPARPVSVLLERDENFARAMFARLAQRMHELVAEIESSTLLNARQRIASYLTGLAGAASRVRLPVTKTLVASQLGVTKETLSRLLREFSDQGLIQVYNRNIVVRDRAGLAAVAHPVPEPFNDKPASGSSSR
jgi:CRP/FNR family transcriptional regulator, dissimilatory nitrate respiration regulator